MSIERIQIEGYLGNDPTRPSEKNTDLVTFSVGVSQSIKNKTTNEYEAKTNWYKCNSWSESKSNFLFTSLKKGDKVVIFGRPSYDTYTAQDSTTKFTVSVAIDEIVLMKKKDSLDYAEQLSAEKLKKHVAQTSILGTNATKAHCTIDDADLDCDIPF